MSNNESKSFIDLLNKQFITNSEYNTKYSENGAKMYDTAGSMLVDLYYRVSSYRFSKDYSDFINRFIYLYDSNRELAIVFLFYLRDIRSGLGERSLFRLGLSILACSRDNVVRNLIELVPEYGRYDDLFVLIDSKYDKDMINLIYTQLSKDIDNMMNDKPISLLAKWLPSVNASSDDTRRIAYKLRTKLGYKSDRDYRKILSSLRKYLKVVERSMSLKRYDEINYSSVPSVAMSKHYNAFSRNDYERFSSYLDDLSSGKAKVNTKALYPYQVVSKLVTTGTVSEDVIKLCNNQWKSILKEDRYDFSNILVVRDGSHSMVHNKLYGSTALDICDSLTLYTASKLCGYYRGKFITFSSTPKLVQLEDCTNLYKSIKYLRNYYCDCSNTDIEKVFKLILYTLVSNNLSQSELPGTVLVISDMEFDPYSNNVSSNLFDQLSKDYVEYGYKLPKLVFWNVSSSTNAIPVVSNTNGVIYLSGFSPNALKLVESGEIDPEKALLSILNSSRYTKVREALEE